MNDQYVKYQKGKFSNINVSVKTKQALEDVMIKMGKKISYDKVVLELINSYLCKAMEVEYIDNLFNDEK